MLVKLGLNDNPNFFLLWDIYRLENLNNLKWRDIDYLNLILIDFGIFLVEKNHKKVNQHHKKCFY